MKLKKIENESEKRMILALMEKDYETYAEIARASKISKPWAKQLIKKYGEQGIIINKTIKGKSVYRLNKNRIKLKTFSFELLKQLMTLPTIGIAICLSTAFLFGIDALLPIIGGLEVFLPQFLYTSYRMYAIKDMDTVEIFIKAK